MVKTSFGLHFCGNGRPYTAEHLQWACWVVSVFV